MVSQPLNINVRINPIKNKCFIALIFNKFILFLRYTCFFAFPKVFFDIRDEFFGILGYCSGV